MPQSMGSQRVGHSGVAITVLPMTPRGKDNKNLLV